MFKLGVVILIALIVTGSSDAKKQKEELGIETTFKPDTCFAETKDGDLLTMHYTGKLADSGKQFDSSVGRGPFDFRLGAGQVIKGWDQGLVGMCVGEKRTLTIPAHLGYGKRGAGASIPPDSKLVFDVELVKINSKSVEDFKKEL